MADIPPFAKNAKGRAPRVVAELELEAVAEFGVELAGVVVVEAAEGEGVVEQHAGVAYIECVEGYGVAAAEVFA